MLRPRPRSVQHKARSAVPAPPQHARAVAGHRGRSFVASSSWQRCGKLMRIIPTLTGTAMSVVLRAAALAPFIAAAAFAITLLARAADASILPS
jgi:hypothetical protein